MPLAIDIAIAKTNKYASRESGDTVEIVERPGGGMSVIMADGQGSGRAAKALSMQITAKVTALLKEGVRDGASARAANDFLFAMRHGQVSATLDILSVDLKSQTVVITRNGDSACLVDVNGEVEGYFNGERPLGIYPRTRPWTTEIPIGPDLRVIVVSDGVIRAGSRAGQARIDLAELAPRAAPGGSAQEIADLILEKAITLDLGKPRDDMTAVALTLTEHQEAILVRRMSATVPLP